MNQELCSDVSTCFPVLADSAWQQSNWGEYRLRGLWKSIPTHSLYSDPTSQESPSTQTSETTTQTQENSICSLWGSPAQALRTQETEQDYLIQPHLSGEKVSEYCLKLNPASVLLNSLKELSDEDLELFLPPSIWQDTVLKLKQSRRRALELSTRDSDCLSFPTLTSGQTSSTMRPAGQTKCEKWFKEKGLVPPGYQLSAEAMALIMGFPPDWFSPLSPPTPQEESEQDISQEEPLHQHKQPLLLEEFSICPSCKAQTIKLTEGCGICGWLGCDFLLGDKSAKTEIPCLIKQPNQPELKGVIRKDLGDRFVVNVADKSIAVSKLFVYPDFSKSDEQIPPSKEITPPSKNSPTKTRRKKGDGTGYIYRRTITRRGKQYQESYYRYRDESGKLRAKYIPQRLLDKVEEAESAKKPIADILVLLGGDEISRGEQFSTLDDGNVQKSNENNEVISINRGEQVTPPSTKRRKQGYGAGYIECKPLLRSGKEYKQYWYHWEIWRSGVRILKKSRYIPKRLVRKIERMNGEKVAVRKILEVLKNK